MIIKIKDISRTYKINMCKFTQLCGLDFVKKDYIVDSITKYFSNSKYQEYEDKMIDNILFDDGEGIGRKYFKVIHIDNRNDIINLIKFTKTSLLQEYINSELESFNEQCYLEQIRDLLSKIYIDINNNIMSDIGNIKLDFENENLMNIVQKSYLMNANDLLVEENSNFDLLIILINLVHKLQLKKPMKILLIVRDIDHLINKESYTNLFFYINTLIADTDTYFLSTISLNNYPILNMEYIEGVNIVNTEIFNIDNYEKYKEFILNNYPIDVKFSDDKLLELTNMIIQYIGYDGFNIDMRANIILKLINNSMAINTESKTNINNIEITYINS